MAEETMLKEVEEMVGRVKPLWTCKPWHRCGGKGFVADSIFVVGHCRVVWIVLLCDGHIAFKVLSLEGLQLYQEVILQSPVLFVEYNRCHEILEFAAVQQKECPNC